MKQSTDHISEREPPPLRSEAQHDKCLQINGHCDNCFDGSFHGICTFTLCSKHHYYSHCTEGNTEA